MPLAVEQIRRMRGGARSHLMRCADEEYYVVKFQNNPQGVRILANELLAARLAARIGLPTAQATVVEVREGLIRYTEGDATGAGGERRVRRGFNSVHATRDIRRKQSSTIFCPRSS